MRLTSWRFIRTRLAASVVVTVTTMFAVSATAQTEIDQTDWSGGPGAPGPVTDWDDRFDRTLDMAWRSIPGQISLAAAPRAVPIEHIVVPDAGAHGVAAADLNGDGRDDLIVVNPVISFETGAVYWWEREAAGAWVEHIVTEDFEGGYFAGAGDVDSDGDMDILVAAYWGGEPPARDVNGRDGRFAWFENVHGDGSAWTERVVGNWFWGAQYLEAVDIDGDGDQDLLGASSLTNYSNTQEADVAWFENVFGQGLVWVLHEVETDLPGAETAGAADFDGDGDLDIVSGNGDHIYWYDNVLGTGAQWHRRPIGNDDSGANRFDVGDVDGDGDLDFVAACYNCPRISWWDNALGDGSLWRERDIGPGGRIECTELVDVEGDGDLDLMIAAWSSGGGADGGAGWLENLDGQGTAWTDHAVKLWLSGDTWITSGDIDHDGKLDAVVLHAYSGDGATDDITWHDLSTFLPAGYLEGSVLEGQPEAGWDMISWNARLTGDASLGVDVRAGDDPADLGDWTSVPQMPANLGDFIDPGAGFLQYRVVATSSSADASPVLEEIMVTEELDPTAATDTLPIGGSQLLYMYPNPTQRGATLSFRLQTAQGARLRIMDLRGRLIRDIPLNPPGPGLGSASWDGLGLDGRTLPAGVYMIHLEQGGRIVDSGQVAIIR